MTSAGLTWAITVHESRLPTSTDFARAGWELDQHYVAPMCTPTRAALLTGRYWSRFGNTAPSNERVLPWDTVTLAKALKQVGYETAIMGKWHLGSPLLVWLARIGTLIAGEESLPEGDHGIAANYAGDVGIEKVPNVIFVEQFDAGSVAQIAKRWESAKGEKIMSLSPDVPPGSADAKSLLITHIGGRRGRRASLPAAGARLRQASLPLLREVRR